MEPYTDKENVISFLLADTHLINAIKKDKYCDFNKFVTTPIPDFSVGKEIVSIGIFVNYIKLIKYCFRTIFGNSLVNKSFIFLQKTEDRYKDFIAISCKNEEGLYLIYKYFQFFKNNENFSLKEYPELYSKLIPQIGTPYIFKYYLEESEKLCKEIYSDEKGNQMLIIQATFVFDLVLQVLSTIPDFSKLKI